MSFPQYVASKWIGHSITVSGKHYANAVPDELFDRATGARARGQASANTCAQRQAQQKLSETPRNEKKSDSADEDANAPNAGPFRGLRELSTSRGQSRKWSRGESNPRADTADQPHLRRVVDRLISALKTKIDDLLQSHERLRLAFVSSLSHEGQPDVVDSRPIGRQRESCCLVIRQREHTACWQLLLCMLFTWACMLHGAQRQAKHVRSMPVGPNLSKNTR